MSTENEAPGGAEAPSARVIKRYSNRKLYDTKDSRYVTLLQIAELVRGGEEVRIIDNTTKEDLTEVTLAQIIFEEQKSKGQRTVPIQTLKDMIQARTEKVLSDLREGPIGRLIPPPRASDGEPTPPSEKPEPVVAAPPPPPAPSKGRLVEQARVTLEDWQHKIDDRIRAIVPSLKPWHELESEVQRLRERVDALETELKRRDEEND